MVHYKDSYIIFEHNQSVCYASIKKSEILYYPNTDKLLNWTIWINF